MDAMNRPRVVVISSNGGFGRLVMLSLSAMGARAYLICDRRAAYVRFSRACERLILSSDQLESEPRDKLSALINGLHREVGLDAVIATDVASLRVLAGIKGGLDCATYPMSDPATLAKLHNKWSFYELCLELGIPTPRTLRLALADITSFNEVERAVGSPIVIKPMQEHGGSGFNVVRTEAEMAAAIRHCTKCGYADLLAQEYASGTDYGLSILARDGRITHWAAFALQSDGDVEFVTNRVLLECGERLIAATKFTGVANFDARIDGPDGGVKLLECNPRFFGRMKATRLAGLDFVKAGLSAEGLDPIPESSLSTGRYQSIKHLLSRSVLRRIAAGQVGSTLTEGLREIAREPIPLLCYQMQERLFRTAPHRFRRPPD
jgi:biotin carboxylase